MSRGLGDVYKRQGRNSIVFHEAALLLNDIKYGILYRLADKNDFTSHKI